MGSQKKKVLMSADLLTRKTYRSVSQFLHIFSILSVWVIITANYAKQNYYLFINISFYTSVIVK